MLITSNTPPETLCHRAYGLNPFIKLLQEFGLDSAPLLRQAGISDEALNDADFTLAPTEELAFMNLALEKIDQPDLGLRCGPRYHLAFYGMLGLAAMASANLVEAFRVIFKNILMTWSYMDWTLKTEDDVATISLEKRRDLGACYQFMVDRGLSAAYTIACDALGQTLPLLEVNVRQPRPSYAAAYRKLFNCTINFNTGGNDFRFEERYLFEPLQQTETESARIFASQCEQICANLARGGSFAEIIRQHLLQLPRQIASLEAIADRLHITPRTIQRKLAAENTSYLELVESVRKNLAIEYLKTTNLTLDEVAQRLGYSDAPSFSHAFKRWTGKAPGAMRATVHKNPPLAAG